MDLREWAKGVKVWGCLVPTEGLSHSSGTHSATGWVGQLVLGITASLSTLLWHERINERRRTQDLSLAAH